MNQPGSLVERFEAARPRLRRIAQRMLGSAAEAEDALQESWLRVGRADVTHVTNVDGWLTTIVARVCLDALKRRESRREELTGEDPRGDVPASDAGERPEHEAMLAHEVGVALLILLDALAPAERVAFVLHDMFDVPFEEIAPIVGRSPDAARQLASRARRRDRGAPAGRDAATQRHDELVRAFFAASRAGDFSALLKLLDPAAALRADAFVASFGAAPLVEGAAAIADTFVGRWRGSRAAFPASIGGEPAAVWLHEGRPRVLFRFTVAGERIAAIDLVGDPEMLARVEVELPKRNEDEPDRHG